MPGPIELQELMRDPAARRLWFIYNAASSLPFASALELARAAELFIAGLLSKNRSAETSSGEVQPEVESLTIEAPVAEVSHFSHTATETASPTRNRLSLSDDQRDQLLTRLAEGAKNAELATEFGLSPKQVQGIRMGCAREIAKLRDQLSKTVVEAEQDDITAPISVDDIVRYLRQQDDIVVPQENGEFLVNARFHMRLVDLVGRANRMRERQGKPKFNLPSGMSVLPRQTPSSSGHPLFWEQTAPHEPLS